MTRGIVLRAVALVAIAGQLQLLPAAIVCASQHGRAASHCSEGMTQTGPVLSAAQNQHASPLCSLGVGCLASSVAVASMAPAATPDATVFALPVRAILAPPSFDSSPVPPPPQA